MHKAYTYFFVVLNLYALIKYHLYQNVYFNIFFDKHANKIFEIDGAN